MKTCLVLGAGGFIGKSLCKKLARHYKVIAFNRSTPIELEDIENIEIITGDFSSIEDFTPLLNGVNIVYHLISTTIPSEDTNHIDKEIIENIVPTVRLLECMIKRGVNEIIFASSGGTVYGESSNHINQTNDKLNPICSYGVQKKVIEGYLEFYGLYYGLNYKILRISNPYGIGQDPRKPQGVIPIFIYRLFNNEPITVFGDGNNHRDYIYMDDLIDVLIKVASYNGDHHIFNIGAGKAYSLHEIIKIIEEKSGKNFAQINYKNMRKCDVSKTLLDITETQKELGWSPNININSGIAILLEYYKNMIFTGKI
ncbi:NAD-dependent epimerase/dehydratase family protein [Sedimentibacter saalensis]|uniref:NAD-dependent epimerase/dehydratase family protein n=1 Tax=Sedimentibacter saalensis TaxID=130788 RepID=UPI0028A041E9|nr:NAD-dependent epimerase/dehydratase family protein [Sedimentibacter saalensis]